MIHQLLENILAYFQAHPYMGEFFAFIIAFAESLPLIGTIVPGSITMTAMGTLIGTGVIPGFATLGWASLGAFCGDCIGYASGSFFQDSIRDIWPFSKYPKWLIASEDFFAKHGGKSIIIGRFFGPARSSVPLVAGLLDLGWLRFLAAAIPSAILWAIAYMLPGILLGAVALQLPPAKTTEFILIGLVVILMTWFFAWLVQRFFRELAKLINNTIDTSWDWLNEHHSSKFIIKIITNRKNPDDHYQLTLSLIAFISLLLFIFIFLNVACKTSIIAINQPLLTFAQSLRTNTLNNFFILVTFLAQPKIIFISTILIAAGLYWRKQERACMHILALLAATGITAGAFKLLFRSARPTGLFYISHSSSFPSGHTILAFVIYGFTGYLTARLVKENLRWIPYTISILIILLVGLSRLYLGVHWFWDVIGSFMLGLTLLLSTIVSYRRYPPKKIKNCPLNIWLGIVAVAFLLPYSAYTAFKFNAKRLRYMPYTPVVSVSSKSWWQTPLKFVPLYRNNRFGHAVQPFNIQWVGKLSTIRKLLLNHGWKLYQYPHDVKTTLQRFTSYRPEFHMPLLPWLHHNKPPVLTLIKQLPDSKTIVELRIWRSHVSFTDSKLPLWLAAVNLHTPPKNLLSLKHRHNISFSVRKLFN